MVNKEIDQHLRELRKKKGRCSSQVYSVGVSA